MNMLILSCMYLGRFIIFEKSILISQARSSELNKLELRFRPEDPYCHPAFGELRYSSNNLLLKISKTGMKCDDALKDQVQNDDKTQLCADIIARVPEAYHFEGQQFAYIS